MRLHLPRIALALPALGALLGAGPAAAADLYFTGQFTVAGTTFDSGGYTTTQPGNPGGVVPTGVMASRQWSWTRSRSSPAGRVDPAAPAGDSTQP